MLAMQSVDSALPEPLRQLGLSLPLSLFALLLAWLFLGGLILRVAPSARVPFGAAPLTRLFLLGGLAALPWVRSLLWLPVFWAGVTWAGSVPPARESGPVCERGVRASARFLRRGLLADGLFFLSCALFFWAQGGTWSTAGSGYVTDTFSALEASQTAVPAALSTAPAPLSHLHLDLTANTVLAIPTSAGPPEESARPSLRQRLAHKRFFGLPLGSVLLTLWLAALGLKLASGAALLRGLPARQSLRSFVQGAWTDRVLPGVSAMLLSLHLWLCLRGLW